MAQTLLQPESTAVRPWRLRGETWQAIAVCGLLVVAVAVVFGQTLRFEFLHYDDNFFVYAEPHVAGGISPTNIAWTFASGPLGEWYPVAMLSHMLDCQLFGANHPGWHHFTNVLIHAATAVGLFLVLWRMTDQRAVPEVAQAIPASGARSGTSERREGRVSGPERDNTARVAPAGPSEITLQRAVPTGRERAAGGPTKEGPIATTTLYPSATTLWPSAMVAAVFAVHPLHVESVAWIAERRDVLSGLFFVLTLAAYEQYVRQGASWGRYLAVAAMLALGLMSKAMLVTVPAVLLLLDYWPLRRFGGLSAVEPGRFDRARADGGRFPWRIVLEKIPLLALAVGDAAMTVATHSLRKDPLSLSERLANAAVSYVAYLGQFFVPIDLSVHYAHPASGQPAWQVIATVAVLMVITTAVVVWRRSLPYLLVGWFWYVGMLVPVLGIASVAAHARGDRYTYLPQIGLTIALVWGIDRLGAAWPMRRWVFGVGAAVILIALMGSAWRQTTFWQNDRTLWEHAVACDPQNTVALFLLGDSLDGKDDPAAVQWYQQAVKLGPGQRDLYWWARAKAYSNLGNIAARRQNPDQAIADYRAAIEADDTFAPAHMNLGVQLARRGLLGEAALEFEKSRELAPSSIGASWCNLAIAQTQRGRKDEAIANFRKALDADDSLLMAHIDLGVLLAERGEVDEPIAHFLRAIQIDRDLALPYQHLATVLRKAGRIDEAAKYEQQGADAARRFATRQTESGIELARQGKLDEAISQFQVAIAVDPKYVEAYRQLGDCLARQGNIDDAAALYQRAIDIDPSFQPARQGLRQLHP